MRAARLSILDLDRDRRIPACFNPEALTLRSLEAEERREFGLNAQDFAEMLELSLIFDTTETRPGAPDFQDVREWTDAIVTLAQARQGRLPECQLQWGEGLDFRAQLVAYRRDFIHFAANGRALRARLQLSFLRRDRGQPERAEKSTTVQPGETLSDVAGRVFGDARRWRELAEINDIDDPNALSPGQFLLLKIPGPRD